MKDKNFIKRFLIAHNYKTIGYRDTEEEAYELVRLNVNVKRECVYEIKDLKEDTYIPVDEYVAKLKKQERWAKAKPKRPSKPKARRNDTIDEAYSKWLGQQPCIVTGQKATRGAGAYDMHCHHIHGRSRGRNDYMQVPLMGFVHSWGRRSYHSNTKEDFISHWRLSAKDVVEFFEDHANQLKEEYNKKKPKKD